MKSDVYQLVTDRIIHLLESGTVPWHRPWKGGSQAPRNFISQKAYRGINSFFLHAMGFSSPFWLTFKQVQSLDARVKKGEKSFPVVFWKMFEDEEQRERKRVPFLRYYSVFNIAQCEGIEVPAPSEITRTFQPIEHCEQVVAEMPQRPAIGHGGGRACYSPLLDTVSMPEPQLFESKERYYSTLFHELTHATGHASRLNRKEVTDPIQFGSNPYSREELVAEMGAAFLCGHCGIEMATIDQSASYIQNWLERLKDDRKLVIHAAAQAQKACDFILDVKLEDDAPTASKPEETNAVALRECAAPAEIQRCDCSYAAPDCEHRAYVPVKNQSDVLSSRTLTVEGEGDFWKGSIKPKIRLKGCWLQQAGFKPGNRVSVKCVAPGVIELRSHDAKPWPDKMPQPMRITAESTTKSII